jgi:hypothetical protein
MASVALTIARASYSDERYLVRMIRDPVVKNDGENYKVDA